MDRALSHSIRSLYLYLHVGRGIVRHMGANGIDLLSLTYEDFMDQSGYLRDPI